MAKLVIYTTPTCAPCGVAKRRMDGAGVAYQTVDLTADPDALFDLKMRTGRETIHTPLFEDSEGFHDMTGFRDVLERAKAA